VNSKEFFAQFVPIPLVEEFKARGWKDEGPLKCHHGNWSHIMTKEKLDERDGKTS